jgi:hypothetical protein
MVVLDAVLESHAKRGWVDVPPLRAVTFSNVLFGATVCKLARTQCSNSRSHRWYSWLAPGKSFLARLYL